MVHTQTIERLKIQEIKTFCHGGNQLRLMVFLFLPLQVSAISFCSQMSYAISRLSYLNESIDLLNYADCLILTLSGQLEADSRRIWCEMHIL